METKKGGSTAIVHLREAAFESSSFAILVMDARSQRFLDCNPAALRVYGRSTSGEVIGKVLSDMSTEAQYDGTPSVRKAQDYIARALAEGSVVFQWRHLRPNGVVWDGEVHLTRFESQGRTLLQVTLLDVSAQEKNEGALRESEVRLRQQGRAGSETDIAAPSDTALRDSESRFHALFEHASIAVMVLDERGVYTDCNRRATELMRCPKSQILGATPWRFAPDEQPDGRNSEKSAREKGALALQGKPQFFEWVHRRADGTPFESEVSLSAAKSEHGTTMFGFVRDISDRKHAEREREALQAQLVQAQKMEAVGRLAGGVAHDFNNMLSVIMGHTELILDAIPAGDPLREEIQSIQDAAERSAALTRQLLAFARKQAIAPRSQNLNSLVEGMLNMLRRIIGEDITLSWRPGKDLAHVYIDASQVDQILANLCVNARDAIGGVGRVSIATSSAVLDESMCADMPGTRPGPYVILMVSDNGCGMSRETMARVFEPFFTTKAPGKGSGLGLSTVWGIVQQNGGGIRIESEPGAGSTFKVFLPKSAEIGVDQASFSKTTIQTRRSETVLYVEDEPALCTVGQTMLERLGFTVLPVHMASQAIDLFASRADSIDLLITDVVMPEMNGRDLFTKLREMKPQLRCLYVSGYATDVVAQCTILENGIHFLSKPFTLATLSEGILRVLEDS